MNIFPVRLLVLIGLIIVGQFGIFAQKETTVVVPSSRVLLVDLRSAMPPSKISLSSGLNGFWTENIDRIKDWTVPTGALPIQVVNFQARLVREKAELRVSVFSGSRFREKEDLIATYTVGEGESAVVAELAKYGFVPPKIKMIFVESSIANVPSVLNETKSLSVEVAPTIATLPTFLARVSNNSKKPVAGFVWRTMAGNRTLLLGLAHDLHAKPAIPPGEIYEQPVRIELRDPAAGDVTFHIYAVVFIDGSYEGNPNAAADLRSFWYGQKDTLTKIISILKTAVDAAPARPNLAALVPKIESVDHDMASGTVEALTGEFADDANLRRNADGRFKAAGEGVVIEIVRVLKNIDKGGLDRSDEDVNRVVAKFTQTLQEWLDRFSKFK